MDGYLQSISYAQGIADEINYFELEKSWGYVKEVYSEEEINNMKKYELSIFNAVMNELKKPLNILKKRGK